LVPQPLTLLGVLPLLLASAFEEGVANRDDDADEEQEAKQRREAQGRVRQKECPESSYSRQGTARRMTSGTSREPKKFTRLT
jgi:hypothetical protein